MNAMDPRFLFSALRHTVSGAAALAATLLAAPGFAEVAHNSPLIKGWYVAPMASYVEPDSNRQLDAGVGGTLALGYRNSPSFALELYGVYTGMDREVAPSGSATMTGGGVGALAFLDELAPGVYIPLAVGYLEVEDNGADAEAYSGMTFEAGIGYLLPLAFGRYDFAIRAEGRYRHHNGQDGRRLDEEASGVQDALFNVGLQLPFGRVPPEPEPEPVRVVEAVPPPDGDADGVTDDRDQCPDTASGEEVDSSGCALPPPPPPCGASEPDGAIALGGCAAGDVIVLRDVRFEFNRASLTSDDLGVLDEVAAVLAAHPEIRVEIGGHTDSKGSDAYNARLSAQRAEAVRDYLAGEGVAADRMEARGYGESRPIADNETDEGRELNRRVELTIVSGE